MRTPSRRARRTRRPSSRRPPRCQPCESAARVPLLPARCARRGARSAQYRRQARQRALSRMPIRAEMGMRPFEGTPVTHETPSRKRAKARGNQPRSRSILLQDQHVSLIYWRRDRQPLLFPIASGAFHRAFDVKWKYPCSCPLVSCNVRQLPPY